MNSVRVKIDSNVKTLLQNILDIVHKYLGQRGSYKVYLFGSRSRGNNQRHSDIDIAIQADYMTDIVFRKIKREVDSYPTLYTIDLIDLNNIDKEFRALIQSEMVQVFPDNRS